MENNKKTVLKVRVPRFIINLMDKSGLLSLESQMTVKEMDQLALYNYEHRTANGELRGTGKTYMDWIGNLHIVQKDAKGKKIYESIHMPDGSVLKRKTK